MRVYIEIHERQFTQVKMASKTRADNTCVCQICTGIRLRLRKIFTLLDTYGWLLDTYIVDFFEDNVWIKLPGKWRDTLSVASPEEIGSWASAKNTGTRVWPLSLLAFQKAIESLGINRDYENREILKCCGSGKNKSLNTKLDNKVISSRVKRKHLEQEHQKLLSKSVKKKKRHEIENIAETASECSYQSKCECIVDIGAGLGHLARTLAYNYSLCVVCVEQNESLSQQARIFDEKLFNELRKKIPDIARRTPRHISTRVAESDARGEELIKKLRSEFTESFTLNNTKFGFGLIGLHTCGDLAANLLRLYSELDETRFICIVGCCYMKITCGTKEGSFGYPLSKFVSKAENHEFSYAALEVACHAIENYCGKLRTGHYQDLLVHAYRATLEVILIRKNGKGMKRSHLKNVKLKENMTFERYCRTAIGDLEPENRPDTEDFRTPEVRRCLDRWREVVAFGTLRFMLAPLVETAVLFDRFLYLSEENLSPSLQPIFDPKLSPRNVVLTSCK